jgi:hypothetical protein
MLTRSEQVRSSATGERGIAQTYAARIVLNEGSSQTIAIKGNMMKKAILACAAALTTLCAMVPAHADDHHHPVCHRVHAHGHWERHCH